MRAFRMTAFAASLLLASGCVVVSGGGGGGGGGGSTGSVTISYTFAGSSCTTAGVATIQIKLVGQSQGDSASKTVNCVDDPQGITIDNFIPDTYDVTITGLDANQNAIYGMSTAQTVTVAAGSNTYAINVPALVGDLTVSWGAFGSYADCSSGNANIPTIEAILEDANGNSLDDQTYNCSDGGVTWNQIDPGTYTVVLYGIASDGLAYYAASSQVDVVAGQANDYTVDLADNTGKLTVQWTFGGSGACGIVTQVHLKITDSNGNVFDDNTYNCGAGGWVYDNTPAGTYTVDAQGIDSNGGVQYQGTNANVTVVAQTSQTYIVDMN